DMALAVVAKNWMTWGYLRPSVMAVADKDRLVGTGEAARAMGIHPRTLQRYVQDGLVKPDVILPRPRRPQYRWNIRKLREQIKAIATRDDWNPDLRDDE
ncbi:MAG: hypothetical protein J2P20_18860, partial [Pseudonocardia sp.]|nr:hypothetical protein [Pseudonocardia sp.]